MKVTVCFGAVRVVVPCSDGNLTIADLTDRAILRFLKATRGSPARRIYVQKLIASSDGGILDPSDRLRDVVDDRDQIIAVFEERAGTMRQHSGGDGTSASSQSASSPEMFPDDHVNENDLEEESVTSLNRDVFISSQDLITDSGLVVRRGSEPVLGFNELVTVYGKSSALIENPTRPLGSLKDCHEIDSDSGVSGSDSADRKTLKRNGVNQIKNLNSPSDNFTAKPPLARSVGEKPAQPSIRQGSDVASDIPEKVRFSTGNVAAFWYNSVDEVDSDNVADSPVAPPPPVPPRNSFSQLTLQNSMATSRTNTRILGKKISIQLAKGHSGLGFSVTTRDNPAGGNCPIYIKNILPQGAAVENGQLRTGDRLLQINDVEVTGKSQSEVVSILRGVAVGSAVDLVISRQELMETNMDQLQQSFLVDHHEHSELLSGRELTIPVISRSPVSPGNVPARATDVDILVFDICLNSSEIQGLGITIKGKTVSTSEAVHDRGIFVKSVIDGGAAQKDGRLQPNDQLCEANGECLLNMSNLEATNALRSAICVNSKTPGFVQIIVARKKLDCFDSKSSTFFSDSQNRATIKSTGRDTLRPVQSEGNRMHVSSSQSLHNLSYQQAISSASMKEVLPSPTGKKEDSLPLLPIVADNIDTNIAGSQMTCGKEYSKSVGKKSGNEALYWDCANSDVTLETSSSDTESRPAFQREGFGRQSMSEKRKARLDPRTTEVYQKIKQNKSRFGSASLDRAKSKARRAAEAVSLEHDTRQSLGRQMSVSCESLSAAIQDADQQSQVKTDKDTTDNKGPSRGVNNSFRAAVDRSYENALDADSVSANECIYSNFSNDISSQNKRSYLEETQTPKKEKSGGIFKGLGGILRFGRTKKSEGKLADVGHDNIRMRERGRPHSANGERLWLSADKYERQLQEIASKLEPLQAQGKRDSELLDGSKCLTSSKSEIFSTSQKNQFLSSSAPSRDSIDLNAVPHDQELSRNPLCPKSQKLPMPSPSSRLIVLRQEYQQLHRERCHQYPLDVEDDKREQCQRELERKDQEIMKGMLTVQYRTKNEMPGSRFPYLERPMSLGSDYQNVDVIRNQLHHHDNNQQRYNAELARQQQQQQQQPQQQRLTPENQQPLREQQSSFYEQKQKQEPLAAAQQRQQEMLLQHRQQIQFQQPLQRQQQSQQHLVNEYQAPVRHQYSHSYSSQPSNPYCRSPYKNELQYRDYHSSGLSAPQDYFYNHGSQNWKQPVLFDGNTPTTAFANYGQAYCNQGSDRTLSSAQLNQPTVAETRDGYLTPLNFAQGANRTKHYYY